MNYTQHYQLPQWVETDRILMEDFNDSYSKLDAALAEHGAGLSALETSVSANTTGLAAKGNCQLYTLTYTGTGTGSCSFTVPGNPVLAMAMGEGDALLALRSADTAISFAQRSVLSINASLTNQSVSWQGGDDGRYCCNYRGNRYALVVLLEK